MKLFDFYLRDGPSIASKFRRTRATRLEKEYRFEVAFETGEAPDSTDFPTVVFEVRIARLDFLI